MAKTLLLKVIPNSTVEEENLGTSDENEDTKANTEFENISTEKS